MSDWDTFLQNELQHPYMQQTLNAVENRRAEGIAVYPPEPYVFNAFNATPLNNIRVVILGKDKLMGCVFLLCPR